MTIPENKHNKILNACRYFLDKKPSEMNGAEILKLKKFCRFVLGEASLSDEEIHRAVNDGILPGQQTLPKVL